jgi:N-acetylmuramic acid 6-phosphate etherase
MNNKFDFNRLNLSILLLAILFCCSTHAAQEKTHSTEPEKNLLKLLRITPSPESVDYVLSKTQFQLHTLLTEQRHPKTWNLSEKIRLDYEAGLRMLFSVDEDIVHRLEELIENIGSLEQAVLALEGAILNRQKIYIYGCGATGRLAKQMESTFWRPFWRKVQQHRKIWNKVMPLVGESIEDRLIGEMTGADRALISSLEGFEDLLLIGQLQLKDRKIGRGDVVLCVTEGGETSSVIGTILAALDQWKKAGAYAPDKARKSLYFVYNNPDERLLPFDRSRAVLDEPGITRINLTTGPQAITGSTRMQATTIETFVVGNILQVALDRVLRRCLSRSDLNRLGFKEPMKLEKKLSEFSDILKTVQENIPAIAGFTALEAKTYKSGHFSTYLAQKGLITVFIDSTERSPTFRLYPLDTIKEEARKCWIQVWTPASGLEDAWKAFLGRPFRGLSPEFYGKPFDKEIEDAYLKRAALTSLKNAGNDQQFLYDFAFAKFNLKNRGPQKGDLGVLVVISPEENLLENQESDFLRFIRLFVEARARTCLISITDTKKKDLLKITRKIPSLDDSEKNPRVIIRMDAENDPLGLNQQIALKIILNAHSTAVMARLRKVIGNTMTNVSPSNLKLIGRATYLIQSHVNDVLGRPQWVKQYGTRKHISYGEANAVLFEAIAYLKDKQKEVGQTAEVALSIIRILESLRFQKGLSQQEAFAILKSTGLSQYLEDVTSQPE